MLDSIAVSTVSDIRCLSLSLVFLGNTVCRTTSGTFVHPAAHTTTIHQISCNTTQPVLPDLTLATRNWRYDNSMDVGGL